jgi:hypothetical protein
METIRDNYLAERIVIVDGLPGCGKTMLSPIISALDRVELLSYAYEIENVCSLYSLGKIEINAASTLIGMWTDLKLYNIMMSREVNFRFSDLSGVFKDARPSRYIKRLFQKGDECVPGKIKAGKPVLSLTTHSLLENSQPVFYALEKRVAFIEVVRHPLYMIKQQFLNMEKVLNTPRHFALYVKYKNHNIPSWAFGWEERFLKANGMEKTIYAIENMTKRTNKTKELLGGKHSGQIITIPFESFVVNPWPYMEKIETALGTKVTAVTRKMMKRQKVPRKMYAEGINLKIYKRCGWEAPEQDSNENREFEIRRQFAAERASKEALETLDALSRDYEEKYMGGVKKRGEHYA